MAGMYDDSQGWRKLTYSAGDGLQLAGRMYGFDRLDIPADRTAAICLAGLTRNSADFHELALRIAYRSAVPRRVLALDYRGRGMSQWDKNWENYNPLTEVDDTLAGAVAAGIGHAAIIGTSRGGMLAMAISAIRPSMLRAVVLNDVGPEIDGRGLLRIKTYIEKASDHATWSSATGALKLAAQAQFPDWDDGEWDRQARLIFTESDGKVVRRYDPALLKTLLAINLDLPLPTLWPQFAGLRAIPVLAIRGEKSDLLSPETFARMASEQPLLEQITVARQGHAPDLGMAPLAERIDRFLVKADTAAH
ncbi:MAG: alpha/beta hydrolase [Rhizobiaceae bacterium]